MKALSIRQPWAWLIVHGGKRIENRAWNTSFRGEFLIHAAKGMTKDEYDDAWSFARGAGGWDLAQRIPSAALLERGGIVGRARLVDVIDPCCPPEYVGGECSCRGGAWHIGTQYGFVLEDVVALPFEPVRGALGFFEVPR